MTSFVGWGGAWGSSWDREQVPGSMHAAASFSIGSAGSLTTAPVVVAEGGWRGAGATWDWLLEVKPRKRKPLPAPRRKKIERIVAEAVSDVIADHLDDELAVLEDRVEQAIKDTQQGVRVAERALFKRYVAAELAWQREVQALRRQQLQEMAQRAAAEKAAQAVMEQAAARRRRLKRVALFLSVQD